MARKPKDPFARQFHPGPNFSLTPEVRWEQARTVGTYHLHVAALGGEPQETTFLLTTPAPSEVTRTAEPRTGTSHGAGR